MYLKIVTNLTAKIEFYYPCQFDYDTSGSFCVFFEINFETYRDLRTDTLFSFSTLTEKNIRNVFRTCTNVAAAAGLVVLILSAASGVVTIGTAGVIAVALSLVMTNVGSSARIGNEYISTNKS